MYYFCFYLEFFSEKVPCICVILVIIEMLFPDPPKAIDSDNIESDYSPRENTTDSPNESPTENGNDSPPENGNESPPENDNDSPPENENQSPPENDNDSAFENDNNVEGATTTDDAKEDQNKDKDKEGAGIDFFFYLGVILK